MASLPQYNESARSGGGEEEKSGCGTGCGTSCGAGLEKIYPSTAVRYGAMRWVGEFTYKPGSVFKCGGRVVIQSDRGIELGEQVSLTCGGCSNSVTREQIKQYIDNSGPEFYKLRAGRILREATTRDLDEHTRLNGALMGDLEHASLVAAQHNLDMKLLTVEHLLGGERVVYYFRSEQRVDFRDLVRDLARYHQTRIEMRQVGARDEARVVADYEICGRECCCKNFLKKMRPVSMRMAKLQKATLDPSKVSGRCGRLRCCLRYEHEGYEELAAKLPRQDSWVDTEYGVSQVLDRQILTQLVLVRPVDGREVTIPLEEIRAFDVPPPERMPEEPPHARSEMRRPPRPSGPLRETGGPPRGDASGASPNSPDMPGPGAASPSPRGPHPDAQRRDAGSRRDDRRGRPPQRFTRPGSPPDAPPTNELDAASAPRPRPPTPASPPGGPPNERLGGARRDSSQPSDDRRADGSRRRRRRRRFDPGSRPPPSGNEPGGGEPPSGEPRDSDSIGPAEQGGDDA